MKSIKRIKKFGEVFTPPDLVNEILDKVWLLAPDVFQDATKTFCDPACGNGNFLVEVLAMKLDHGHNPTQALSTIYGVDIQEDNVEECRNRLLEIAGDTPEHREIVIQNIVCADALKYHFRFDGSDPYSEYDESLIEF